MNLCECNWRMKINGEKMKINITNKIVEENKKKTFLFHISGRQKDVLLHSNKSDGGLHA